MLQHFLFSGREWVYLPSLDKCSPWQQPRTWLQTAPCGRQQCGQSQCQHFPPWHATARAQHLCTQQNIRPLLNCVRSISCQLSVWEPPTSHAQHEFVRGCIARQGLPGSKQLLVLLQFVALGFDLPAEGSYILPQLLYKTITFFQLI